MGACLKDARTSTVGECQTERRPTWNSPKALSPSSLLILDCVFRFSWPSASSFLGLFRELTHPSIVGGKRQDKSASDGRVGNGEQIERIGIRACVRGKRVGD